MVLSSISDFHTFALIILEIHIIWEELFSGGFLKGSTFFFFKFGGSEGMEENKERRVASPMTSSSGSILCYIAAPQPLFLKIIFRERA